ncbi:hypothetical protein I4U23_011608 [Adineta vaga]|nr:hypothetical protein I4U23_011608 [Adineta vaga]
MASEVLHLQIGSKGIEIGNYFWELYCLEHNLSTDGCLQNDLNSNIDPPQCCFSERNDCNKRNYRPYTSFIDHNSTTIEKVENKQNEQLV